MKIEVSKDIKFSITKNQTHSNQIQNCKKKINNYMSFAINISSQVTRAAYRRFTTALLNRIWNTAENSLPTREYANKIQTELLTPHIFKILNIIPDRFNSWPVEGPSAEISFNESRKCIGNGEEKTKTILGIEESVGGQNNVADFNHPILGSCSVKDMTNDSCTLGTEGRGRMHKILNVVRLVIFWANKYKDDDLSVKEIYTQLNKKHGSSRTTILNGLDNIELSGTNLKKLTKIIDNIIANTNKFGAVTAIHNRVSDHSPWQNDFLEEICQYFADKNLQEKLNEAVRQEATDHTLIIVHRERGWLIAKNLEKITCPRITRGAPRINYEFSPEEESK